VKEIEFPNKEQFITVAKKAMFIEGKRVATFKAGDRLIVVNVDDTEGQQNLLKLTILSDLLEFNNLKCRDPHF